MSHPLKLRSFCIYIKITYIVLKITLTLISRTIEINVTVQNVTLPEQLNNHCSVNTSYIYCLRNNSYIGYVSKRKKDYLKII